ncbi:MAG TPA: zinc-binding dehydrogenase [Stellaceae bacterium]|nr:zinc-binding dehydrogenase [Stellaceae bacterium]
MKAVVFHEFGPPEVMRVEEVPTPEPGPGEVQIEVRAVSVNTTLDLIVRAGKYPLPVKLPHVLGVDPSGVVAKLGAGVTTRRVGDRVTTDLLLNRGQPGPRVMLGLTVWGGYAQYVVVPAACTYLLPDGVDFATATVVSRHAPLAFSMLRDKARVQPGEWVLVMGAAGGLGSAAVQAAKYFGARVIAAAGSDERVKAAMGLGADAGVNYRAADLTAEVKRITGGNGADVVLENIGDPELFSRAFLSLGRGGRLVTAGAHGGGIVPVNISHLYINHITIMGWTGQSDADLNDSLKAAADGRYRVLIDRIMPLSAAAEAHYYVAARSGLGKVILDPTRLA